MKFRDREPLGLASLLAIAGVAHFVTPDGFDAIVPRLLPGSRRFWTVISGTVEISLAIGVSRPATRRVSATLTAILLVAVFPANIQMAVDWRSRPAPQFAFALIRLPLQIPLIWWAWHVGGRATAERGGMRRSSSP